MILAGHLRKVLMQSYYVKWRRAELHGKKPTKLIGSVELMLIDLPPHPIVHKIAKKWVTKTNPCLVGTTRKTPVLIKVTKRQGDVYTSTFVAIVTLKGKMLLIP